MGSKCVESFTVLCTSISQLWSRMCSNYLWPRKVVMATIVVDCMCMQSTIVEVTGIMQIQPKCVFLAFFWLLNVLPWQSH